jgi:hypothetical protein
MTDGLPMKNVIALSNATSSNQISGFHLKDKKGGQFCEQ